MKETLMIGFTVLNIILAFFNIKGGSYTNAVLNGFAAGFCAAVSLVLLFK
jgi:hypothetical protein